MRPAVHYTTRLGFLPPIIGQGEVDQAIITGCEARRVVLAWTVLCVKQVNSQASFIYLCVSSYRSRARNVSEYLAELEGKH